MNTEILDRLDKLEKKVDDITSKIDLILSSIRLRQSYERYPEYQPTKLSNSTTPLKIFDNDK